MLSHHVCTFLYAILGSVIEKTFIAKIHKALSKEIYRWKINDAYHGGVPDVYYSGLAGCVFVEYKYHKKIPVLIEIELIEPSLYFNLDPLSSKRFAIEFDKRFGKNVK